MKKLKESVRIALFCLLCSLYFFSYFHRIAVPGTIFNELQASFNLSASGVASLGTLCLYIYGFMQFFAGILSDAFGSLKVLLTGGVLLTAGSFAFSLAPELGILFASRALVGFGASLIYVCLFKALHELFSRRDFPVFLGVALFLGYSGGLFGTLPLERLVALAGWRATFFWLSVVNGLFLLAAFFLAKMKVGFNQEKAQSFSGEMMWEVYTNRNAFPIITSAVINFSLYFLLQAMLGRKFLQDFSGFDSLTATSFTFGMIFVSMGVSLLAGFGTRALNRRKPIMVAATSLCFIAVSLLVMGVFGFPLGKFFLLPYLLLGFSSGASLVFSTSVREVNPAEAVGTAVGFLNGVCYLSIAVLMNLSGWVMDRYAPRSITSFGAIIYPAGA
ncbi:MAG: MFS transporter, partial [Candidatus Omnitrophica bacterium]|nr:MFS transporter [Candidatus Omnitrophota bacterium]